MRSLYLNYTPYHLLLSCSISLDRDESENKDLLIFTSFSNVEKLVKAIKDTNFRLFNDIRIYPGSNEFKRYGSKIKTLIKFDSQLRVTYRNIKKIKKYFNQKNDIRKIYTFNDRTKTSQVLEYLNSKRKSINIYVEDGLGAYINPIFENNASLSNKCFQKIIYRPWAEKTNHGGYKHTDKLLLFKPTCIKKEIKEKKIEKLQNDSLRNLLRTDLIKNILKRFNINLETIKDTNKILVCPHSEFLYRNNILEEYRKIIKKIIDNEKKILIKYHPRETQHYLKTISNNDIAFESIPLEVIYLHLINNPPKAIIGNISTSLYTAKLILKETKIISLINILNIREREIKEIFEGLNIYIPKNMSDLNKSLEKE